MSGELNENIASLFKRFLPQISSLLLLFLSYIPADLGVLNNIRPAMGLICVYFWMLHRSDLFNLWSVYFLGFIDDIVTSAPLGSNVFSLLILYVLINNLSRFFNAKPFVITWYGFMLLALLSMFARWLLVSVYYRQFLPVDLVFFSYLVTVAAYPLISLLLAYIQNTWIQDGEE